MNRSTRWGLGLVTAGLVAGSAALAAPAGGGNEAGQGTPGCGGPAGFGGGSGGPGGFGPGGGGPGGQGMERRQGPPMPGPERLKELGATDAQLKALKQLRYEQESQNVTLRANQEHAELDLRHAMEASPVDTKAVMAAVDAVSAARAEQFKAEIAGALKMRETLGDTLFEKVHARPEPPQGDGQNARPPQPGATQGGRGPQAPAGNPPQPRE